MVDRLTISNGNVMLEGALYAPESGAYESVVVVCHPHPQNGGDMNNNVVKTVALGALNANAAALIFNFRGVGRSTGSFDGGAGEQTDVRAAIEHARGLPGVQRVLLAGYSFGARQAAAVVDDGVVGLALVAPPTSSLAAADALRSYAGPVLLVAGTNDHVSATDALESVASQLAGEVTLHIVDGADHFWWGREHVLAELTQSFFEAALAR